MSRKKQNMARIIKEQNVAAVTRCMRKLPYGTKTILARKTGLSTTTCGTILEEMAARNEAGYDGLEESSGGRPAKKYVYNHEYFHIICVFPVIEDGEAVINYAVANAVYQVVEQGKRKDIAVDERSINSTIGELMRRYGNTRAVSIGIPGTVHDSRILGCAISELNIYDLKERIENKFGVKAVVENDMQSAAIGYFSKNKLDASQPVTLLKFGKNSQPGSGSVCNGSIIQGFSGFAGDMVQMEAAAGTSPQMQLERIKDEESFIKTAAMRIIALVSVINPIVIVLTGERFTEENISRIKAVCSEYILPQHLPEFVYKSDLTADYTAGLIYFAEKIL